MLQFQHPKLNNSVLNTILILTRSVQILPSFAKFTKLLTFLVFPHRIKQPKCNFGEKPLLSRWLGEEICAKFKWNLSLNMGFNCEILYRPQLGIIFPLFLHVCFVSSFLPTLPTVRVNRIWWMQGFWMSTC